MKQVPMYVLKFITDLPGYKDLYYRRDAHWTGVPKDQAQHLTTKEARKVQQHLRQPRIGLVTELEAVK